MMADIDLMGNVRKIIFVVPVKYAYKLILESQWKIKSFIFNIFYELVS